MPTMKDVAKLAGVSHGTVSNVINGVKGVRIDKVKRVEWAIKQLGYKPSGIARSLKLNRTGQIDLVFPRAVDATLSQIHECISFLAMEHGYTVSLHITNENAEMEKKILDQSTMYHKDGIILMTCQPYNTGFFERLSESGTPVVLIQRRVRGVTFPYVGIDGEDAFKRITQGLIDTCDDRIAIMAGPDEYTFEAACVEGYKNALFASGFTADSEFCMISGYDRESSFKEAVRMLQNGRLPKAIVTSSSHAPDAVLKAFEVLNLSKEKRPSIISLVPSTWTSITRTRVTYIQTPYSELAAKAFDLLMGDIESKTRDPENILVKIPFSAMGSRKDDPRSAVYIKPDRNLRILTCGEGASEATKSLVSSFEKEMGIKVTYDSRDYPNMYDALKNEWYKSNYDVFAIDNPWMQEFVQKGAIEPLDTFIEEDPNYVNDVPSDIFDDFAVHDGHIYGLPYIFSSQLLFYRQDLFMNVQNQRLFYQMYGTDLVPPTTWGEFNRVAEFFTREYNASSPTRYGTTLGSRLNSGAVCEYLPRLWGFGGQISDGKSFTLNSPEAVSALENYKGSFNYAANTSYDNWWKEQTREFYQGDTAMMILFSDNVTEVMERRHSKIIGKIDYELLPEKSGVKGGWVLAVNAHSEQKELAYRYTTWACSKEMSVLSALLGGCVPCQTALANAEVSNIYPWYRKAMEAKKYLKMRRLPIKKSGVCIAEPIFEDILGRAVYDTVTGSREAGQALRSANEQLNQILEG